MQNIKVLSQNAISHLQLTLPGDKSAITIALPRMPIPPDLVKPFRDPGDNPSNLHKPVELVGRPGSITLSATMGSPIGDGRSSIVFPLENVKLIPSLSPDVALPSFVIKVGRPNRCAAIARESWFYEKLEPLQGVAIPWFYGWFEFELPDESDAYTWKRKNIQIIEALLDSAVTDSTLTNSIIPHKWLRTRCYNPDIFSCLLLERVGELIPRGRELSKETKAAIEDVYADIATLGVVVSEEMFYGNIMTAPESPPGLPSLPSANGRPHAWRHVDLEQAFMPARDLEGVQDFHLSGLKRSVYPEVEELVW